MSRPATAHLGQYDPDENAWFERAVCRGQDPDFFHPTNGQDTSKQKAFCSVCPVRKECGDYALRHRLDYGVWGGMSERERRHLLRLRSVAEKRALGLV